MKFPVRPHVLKLPRDRTRITARTGFAASASRFAGHAPASDAVPPDMAPRAARKDGLPSSMHLRCSFTPWSGDEDDVRHSPRQER